MLDRGDTGLQSVIESDGERARFLTNDFRGNAESLAAPTQPFLPERAGGAPKMRAPVIERSASCMSCVRSRRLHRNQVRAMRTARRRASEAAQRKQSIARQGRSDCTKSTRAQDLRSESRSIAAVHVEGPEDRPQRQRDQRSTKGRMTVHSTKPRFRSPPFAVIWNFCPCGLASPNTAAFKIWGITMIWLTSKRIGTTFPPDSQCIARPHQSQYGKK